MLNKDTENQLETNPWDIPHCQDHTVARSVLGAEKYAFADAFDFAFCAKRDLETILQRLVAMHLFTDSKRLFVIITKNTQSYNRRLMVDLHAVRLAYACHEIRNIGWVRGPKNTADGMTKIGRYSALDHLMCTSKAKFRVEQLVLRNVAKCSTESATRTICADL